MMTENLKLVTSKDHVQIAIWEIFDSEKRHDLSNLSAHKAQNIFLTHGTFSDKKTCLRIAEYLAALGHRCYIMEWRSHGASEIPKDKFNFETIATYDFDATFRYLFDDLKLDNLHCVTHSGGGIGLTMFLIQNPLYIDKINSISMFACQAYGAALNPISYARIFAAKLFTQLFGYIPAKKLNMGPINESYYAMKQWYDWNLKQNFNSSFITQNDLNEGNNKGNNESDCKSGNNKNTPHKSTAQTVMANTEPFDYRQHMPKITTPIYAISAKGDKLISPTRGCQLLFNDFNNPANVFCEYSLSNGDSDDYTHSRIMTSRNAAKEIWPTVAAWIDKHSS
ncbi:alpha/beta fold hydrolase [Psychrobacter sp. DAB_AL32B]|uniref:alpha/beta fold hydrolase n=1 Tax=Psychrobacter sp. DAB_AL32B TaxID=1028414 RepID=UPI000B7CE3A6|nr:alpha/beta fold hydrolase [Psychrobacter sp. DAB_AL32B]OXL25866.1 alpha/beta hydrolase [Psychrobacter sp. DAB_AL32B]